MKKDDLPLVWMQHSYTPIKPTNIEVYLPDDVLPYFKLLAKDNPSQFIVILVTEKKTIQGYFTVSEQYDIQQIWRSILISEAPMFYIAKVKPLGKSNEIDDDDAIQIRTMVGTAKHLGVKLLDFFILADRQHFSLKNLM